MMNKTGVALRFTTVVVFITSAIAGIRFGFGFRHLNTYIPGPGEWRSFDWWIALAFWLGGFLIGMVFLFLSEHLELMNRIAVQAEAAKPTASDAGVKTESN